MDCLNKLASAMRFETLVRQTAAVYWHRYQSTRAINGSDDENDSQVINNKLLLAATCLLLAAKVEESIAVPGITESIDHFMQHIPKDMQTHQSISLQEIIRIEVQLVRRLSFDLFVDHPYRYLAEFWYRNRNENSSNGNSTNDAHLIRSCLMFLNDCHLTSVVCRFEPIILALASLRFAIELLDRNDLYLDIIAKYPSNEQMDQAESVINEMINFYTFRLTAVSINS
jgi:hypothetical protein